MSQRSDTRPNGGFDVCVRERDERVNTQYLSRTRGTSRDVHPLSYHRRVECNYDSGQTDPSRQFTDMPSNQYQTFVTLEDVTLNLIASRAAGVGVEHPCCSRDYC